MKERLIVWKQSAAEGMRSFKKYEITWKSGIYIIALIFFDIWWCVQTFYLFDLLIEFHLSVIEINLCFVPITIFFIAILYILLTVHKTKCHLWFLIGIIFILIIKIIVLFYYLFIQKDDIISDMKEIFIYYFSHYEKGTKTFLNNHLENLECCGIDHYKEWIIFTNCSSNTTVYLPQGCCGFSTVRSSCSPLQTTVHMTGCFTQFKDTLNSYVYTMLCVSIVLILQLALMAYDAYKITMTESNRSYIK